MVAGETSSTKRPRTTALLALLILLHAPVAAAEPKPEARGKTNGAVESDDRAPREARRHGKRAKKAGDDRERGKVGAAARDNTGPSRPGLVPAGPPVDPIARARVRETLLRGRAEATEQKARAHALATYRLARRREAEVLANGKRAAETARALEAAVVVLRRSAWETAALRKEVVHAARERAALEKALLPAAAAPPPPGQADDPTATAVPAAPSAASLDPATDDDATIPALGPLALSWPARGTIVSGPGLRRDPATGTESIAGGIEILSRMNEPAIAVAAGHVRAVVALPQGGHAVVIAHDDRRISIVAGLRVVSVAAGDRVTGGQNLGFVGRDLDGAPVLAFELWRDGAPIDPRPYLAGESPSLTRSLP